MTCAYYIAYARNARQTCAGTNASAPVLHIAELDSGLLRQNTAFIEKMIQHSTDMHLHVLIMPTNVAEFLELGQGLFPKPEDWVMKQITLAMENKTLMLLLVRKAGSELDSLNSVASGSPAKRRKLCTPSVWDASPLWRHEVRELLHMPNTTKGYNYNSTDSSRFELIQLSQLPPTCRQQRSQEFWSSLIELCLFSLGKPIVESLLVLLACGFNLLLLRDARTQRQNNESVSCLATQELRMHACPMIE